MAMRGAAGREDTGHRVCAAPIHQPHDSVATSQGPARPPPASHFIVHSHQQCLPRIAMGGCKARITWTHGNNSRAQGYEPQCKSANSCTVLFFLGVTLCSIRPRKILSCVDQMMSQMIKYDLAMTMTI